MTMSVEVEGAGGSVKSVVGRGAEERPAMGRVVRAVIGKELRQNWVNLALVICLEFIIVFVAEWFRTGWLFDSRNDNQIHNILLLPAVQSAITLGCGVAGLLLGVLQPLADRNFDLWAFLNHRPVPRSWLYVGRALAGMILYFVAAGLPVAFALIIAPTKMGGRFFLWEYMLPPIADWVAGLTYYFAGLLIMERQARWYGSRVAPEVMALGGSLAGWSVFSFWSAVSISLVLLVVYVLGSAGSAVSHGFTVRAPRWGSAALGALMQGGLTLIFAAPTAVSLSKIASQRNKVAQTRYTRDGLQLFWDHPTEPMTSQFYELMPDASITKVTNVDEWNNEAKAYKVRSHMRVDLAGKPVADPQDKDIQVVDQRSMRVNGPLYEDKPAGYRELGYYVTEL